MLDRCVERARAAGPGPAVARRRPAIDDVLVTPGAPLTAFATIELRRTVALQRCPCGSIEHDAPCRASDATDRQHGALGAQPLPWLDELNGRYGNVFTMYLPRLEAPVVIFAEPSAVRELWTGDPQYLNAGQANVILRSVLGKDSLLVLDGERHLRERRLMLPPFHGERMTAYGDAMREVTLREVERWPIGRPFPVHESTQAITLDVIMRTIFGVGRGTDPPDSPARCATRSCGSRRSAPRASAPRSC